MSGAPVSVGSGNQKLEVYSLSCADQPGTLTPREMDVTDEASVNAACTDAGWPFFPHSLEVFHWHGDRFEVPHGAKLLAISDACDRQGFAWGGRVLGLQFHLETTEEGAKALIQHATAIGRKTAAASIFSSDRSPRPKLQPESHTQP